jgi:membrane protease YdiL (CAAX protease family)
VVLVCWAVMSVVLADDRAQPVDAMVQNATVSLAVIVPTAIVNGAYEEVFLLGFLARGLRGHGASVALGVSLLVRILYHTYQGPLGVVSMLVFGGVLGAFYLRTGGLFPVVFAHILADIIPFL